MRGGEQKERDAGREQRGGKSTEERRGSGRMRSRDDGGREKSRHAMRNRGTISRLRKRFCQLYVRRWLRGASALLTRCRAPSCLESQPRRAAVCSRCMPFVTIQDADAECRASLASRPGIPRAPATRAAPRTAATDLGRRKDLDTREPTPLHGPRRRFLAARPTDSPKRLVGLGTDRKTALRCATEERVSVADAAGVLSDRSSFLREKNGRG